MKEQKFNITGMMCSACQAHVENAVKKLDGIESVSVNLLANTMDTRYENVANERTFATTWRPRRVFYLCKNNCHACCRVC